MAKRENGSGSIVRRKLANGIKYVAYAPATYTEDPDGRIRKHQQKLGSFSKKSDARAVLDEYLKHPTSKYNFTLRNLYEEWKSIAFQDIAKQTKTNYTTCWEKITTCPSPQIADKMLREITTADMRRVLDYYADGNAVKALSRSYITKIKALLTQLYDYALENNIVDRNYASLVKLPKMETSKARAFTDLEFQKLEKNWKTVAGGDACLVLCYTGWRVTEFCELTQFSYDPKAQTLTGGLKTDAGRDRVVPVHPKIQPIISQWYSASKGPLFARSDGRPYNKDTFMRNVWRPCMDALGLPSDLTPHSARHTCATRLSAAGVPAEDIQRILGHADYSVTANTYVNQDLATLRASMAKVG
jgi:integrase